MRLMLLIVVGMIATTTSSAQRYPTRPDHVTSQVQEESIGNDSLGIADNSHSRELLPYANSLIEDFESWVPEPYDDASRYCTIGFGHLITKASCGEARDKVLKYPSPLTKTAGRALLDQDTALARAAVSKFVTVNLNDKQFGALVSFVFNVGADNFSKSSLLQYINAGAFEPATRQFGRWVISKNKILDGLVTRRAREAALFSGRLPIGKEKVFSRSMCSSLGVAPESDSLIDIALGEK